MNCTPKKRKDAMGDITEQAEKIFAERGNKVKEEAINIILQEEIECKEAREALNYFMTEYWLEQFRAALLSLVCEAVGGDPDITEPIAVSTTLIGGAIDIHDDIIDQSKIKYSRSTVLGKFGKDIALLVGDALLFKAFALLYEAVKKGISSDKIAIVIGIIKKMFFELGDAEALELHFRGRMDVTPEEYLHVMRKKAADIEAHTRIGAVLGGGSEDEIEALSEYGRLLGILMLLADDLMDMVDFKEIANRIKRESLPLPILYALQKPEVKSTLSLVLLKKRITKKDAEIIFRITNEAGGLEQVEKLMEELVQSASSHVENFRYAELLILILRFFLHPIDELRADLTYDPCA